MTDPEKINQALAALEAQRPTLGDEVTDLALAALRQRLDPPRSARDIAAKAQRKLVTILFADVSGFTAMSETMDAEEVEEVMNSLWGQLDGAIVSHGGLIDKHIGDAVMALWGAQTAREDEPEQAMHAALAMQAELVKFNERMGARLAAATGREITLRMRIGINTGPVFLGMMGTTGEFTAMGDTVNLASRLEHAAPVGGILISHDAYRHVRGLFDVQPLEPMSIKGKTEPVQTYVVQRAKPRAFRLGTRGVQGVETRMVGREAQLETLQNAWRAVVAPGRLRGLTVVADAGMGKSRLLYEFSNWIELQPERMQIFRARAGEGMVNAPYAFLRDLFRLSFSIQEGDALAVAREKLERGFVETLGPEGVEPAHFIGHLLGFEFREAGSRYLQGLGEDARQIRARAFHAAVRYFTAVSAGNGHPHPVMLLLEDIHWADDDSLDLIEHVAGECAARSIFVIGLSRPSLYTRRAGWGEGFPTGSYTRLDLQPLTGAGSLALVSEILRRAPEAVPLALQNLVVSRAEGNPYYIEELLKMLMETGVIVDNAGQWEVKPERLVEGQVPPTLTGILQTRLDRLEPEERETVQRAAVVGRVFWDSAVTNLQSELTVPLPSGLEPVWGVLQKKEMVFARQASAFAGGHEFIFKHAIFHDVTYESVLKRVRRVYHAQVAEWLAERSGERADEYAGLIGEHFERAGETAHAAAWYARAGKQAQETYAPEAAINFYQKALAFAPPEAEAGWRASLYDGLGEMLHRQARFAEAAQAYAAMRPAAEAAQSAVAQARAWNGLATAQEAGGDYRAALESANQVEAIAQTDATNQRAQIELARSLYKQGIINSRLGQAEAALALGERALAISTQAGARREAALSLDLLASVNDYTLGKHEQAAQYYGQALELFRELGNRIGMGAMLNALGENARLRRDYRTAVTRYQEALKVAREIGARDGEMSSISNIGGARVALGEYAAAEADLREVIRMASESGWGWLSETYRFLAEACLGQNKLVEADECAQRALRLGQETESKEDIGRAWRTLGLIRSRQPQPEQDAATCFAESHQIFIEAEAETEQALTAREWARHELQNGHQESGQQRWQTARTLFERLGLKEEVAEMDKDYLALTA